MTSLISMINDMTVDDNDFKFMAVTDLIGELQKPDFKISPELEQQLCKNIINLIDSKNWEIQTLTIKCLGFIYCKLSPTKLKQITDHLKTIFLSTDSQTRSIASLSFKSILTSLAKNPNDEVLLSFVGVIDSLINVLETSNNDEIKLDSFEIINEFIINFPTKIQAYQNNLCQQFLTLTHSPNSIIRKKVFYSGGVLSSALEMREYYCLLNYLIMEFARTIKLSLPNKFEDELKFPFNIVGDTIHSGVDDIKNIILCLSNVCQRKYSLDNFFDYLVQSLTYCIDNVESLIASSDSSDFDEIREFSFQALENVLKQTSTLINYDSLLPFIMKYSKHGLSDDVDMESATDDCEEEDYEDSEGDDYYESYYDNETYDDFDFSWKVRRASLKAMNSMLQNCTKHQNDIGKVLFPKFLSSLSDHELNVRVEAMRCLITFLKCPAFGNISESQKKFMKFAQKNNEDCDIISYIHDRMTMNQHNEEATREVDLLLKDENSIHSFLAKNMPQLCSLLNNQAANSVLLKELSGKNKKAVKLNNSTNTRRLAISLFKKIALSLPGKLDDQILVLLKIIKYNIEDKSVNNSLKLELLDLLSIILQTHVNDVITKHICLITEICNITLVDSYYRIVLESLDLIQLIAINFKESEDAKAYIVKLVPGLLEKMRMNECDNEIKEKTILTGAIFLFFLHNVMDNKDTIQMLDILKMRLNNESSRLPSIKACSIISLSNLNSTYLIDLLPFALETSCQNFGKIQKNLLHSSILTTNSILSKHYDLFKSERAGHLHLLIDQLFAHVDTLLSDKQIMIAASSAQLITTLLEIKDNIVDPVFSQKLESLLTSDNFSAAFKCLVHSPHLQGQSLNVCLEFCYHLGHSKKFNLIQSLLRVLLSSTTFPSQINILAPISADERDDTTATTQPENILHKDTLKNIANCFSSLLLNSYSLDVVDNIVSLAIQQTKLQNCPYPRKYTNLLIIGNLGGKLNEKRSLEIFEFIIEFISMPNQNQIADTFAGLNISLDEIHLASSISISELVRDSPSLIEHLLTAIKTANKNGSFVLIFFLLNALKEIISVDYFFNPKVSMETWSLLMESSMHDEEGARVIIAECLAKLINKNPELLHAFKDSFTFDKNPNHLCTLILIARILLTQSSQSQITSIDESPLLSTNAMDISTQREEKRTDYKLSDDDKRDILLKIFTFLFRGNIDLAIKKQIMILINAIAHQRTSFFTMILNLPLNNNVKITDVLIEESAVKRELIRLVEMGPFKHEQDDGLDLRKSVFECILTLVDTNFDELPHEQFLECALEGLKDNPDIKISSLQIIKNTLNFHKTVVIKKINQILELFKGILSTSPVADEAKVELKKSQDIKRCTVRVIRDLEEIDQIQRSSAFQECLDMIKKDSNLFGSYQKLSAPIGVTN